MPASQMSKVIQHLHNTLFVQEASDGQLLECFVSRHEQAALEVLVRRHGPMVWGICRRILGNHHDTEDAFQATFLVLVRKAASIAPKEMVGNWLYGVAHQTALKARATAAKRKKRECQVTTMPEASVKDQEIWSDLEPFLDLELSRLPDKYRVVILLCDLQGRTQKEAARQIGCPEGTVATRLARGRVLLAKRLARHGLAVSGGVLAVALAQNAAGCVPSSVVSSTIKAVTLVAAGRGAMISVKVIALTEGVMNAMFLTKLKTVMTVCLVLGLVTFGGILVRHDSVAGQPVNVGQAGEKTPSRLAEPLREDTAKPSGKKELKKDDSEQRFPEQRALNSPPPVFARIEIVNEKKGEIHVAESISVSAIGQMRVVKRKGGSEENRMPNSVAIKDSLYVISIKEWQLFTVDGSEIPGKEVMERFKKGGMVLIAVEDHLPDREFLRLFDKATLILVHKAKTG